MVVCYSMLMKLLEIASTWTMIGPFTEKYGGSIILT